MSSQSVTTFLCAVRRRLWLETALGQLRNAAWVTGSTFFLLALVHVVWGRPLIGFAFVASLAAGLIALLPALFMRASLAECALRSDRHFGGHSLVTTAYELGQVTNPGPAGKTVLARAGSATDSWRQRLGTLWQAPDGIGYVLPVVPVFLAALMYELPLHQDGQVATVEEQRGDTAAAAAQMDIFDNGSSLPELREAIVRNAGEEQGSAQQEVEAGEGASPVPVSAKPRAGADALKARESDVVPAGITGAVNADGRSPGDARRGPDEIASRSDDSGLLFTEQIDMAIARYGAPGAGRNDGGDEFGNGSLGLRLDNSNILPVPAPPAPSAWTTLTTAEVAYARRYLEAAGLRHE